MQHDAQTPIHRRWLRCALVAVAAAALHLGWDS